MREKETFSGHTHSIGVSTCSHTIPVSWNFKAWYMGLSSNAVTFSMIVLQIFMDCMYNAGGGGQKMVYD